MAIPVITNIGSTCPSTCTGRERCFQQPIVSRRAELSDGTFIIYVTCSEFDQGKCSLTNGKRCIYSTNKIFAPVNTEDLDLRSLDVGQQMQ